MEHVDKALFTAVCWLGVLIMHKRAARHNTVSLDTLTQVLESLGADFTQWQYKAEGGANIALGYVGPNGMLQGQLLRLRKIRKDESSREVLCGDQLLPHIPLDYAHKIMKPLIGEEYIVPGVEVPVSTAYLRAWERCLQDLASRPANRKSQHLDYAFQKVVLMIDHTKLIEPWSGITTSTACTSVRNTKPVDVCIELKPKCGIVLPGTRSNTCRFCMHQVQKAKPGSDAMSEYCPMALYSGQYSSVMHALRSLRRTPQNNLRVFIDGVYNTAEGSLNNVLNNHSGWSHVECPEDVLLDLLARIMCKDRVLQRVKNAQSLDTCGVEAVWTLYRKICALTDPELAAVADDDPRLFHQAALVEKWLCECGDELMRETFRRFFISTTAKDCSIMITLRLNDSHSCITSQPSASTHLGDEHLRCNRGSIATADGVVVADYSVAVVDVDPKPFARLQHYVLLDRDIERVFEERGGAVLRDAGKTCFAQKAADGEGAPHS